MTFFAMLLPVLWLAGSAGAQTTTAYPMSDSHIAYYGTVQSPNPTYRLFIGSNSEAVVVTHGTACIAHVYVTNASGFTFTYYGDDGLPHTATPSLATGANVSYTIYAGQSAADHLVIIKQSAGSAYGIAADFLDVTSTDTPAVRNAGTLDGIGYGSYYPVLGSVFSAVGVVEGSLVDGGASAGAYTPHALLSNSFSDGRLRFRATLRTLKIWVYCDGSTLSLDVDDTYRLSVVLPNTATWGWVLVSSTLDASAEHQYGITGTALISPGFYIHALMTLGGSGLSATGAAVRPIFAAYGDSITQATNGPGYFDSSSGFVYRLGLANKYNFINLGIAGTSVVGSGDTSSRITQLVNANPAIAIILYGTNDILGGVPTGFQSAYQDMMTQLKVALPGCRFFCVGILPRGPSVPEATRQSGNTAIQSAVAAVNSPSVTYISPDTWSMSGATGTDFVTNYLTSAQDGAGQLHPNALGYTLITSKLQAVFPPLGGATTTAFIRQPSRGR